MTATIESVQEQIRLEQLEQADKTLATLERSNGDDPQVKFLRGYVRERQFDRPGALAAYQDVLSQHPRHTEAAFRAAVLCDQGGDEDSAVELYERCIEAQPVPVSALLNLAVIYEERGQLEDAERMLDAVLTELPNHFRARHFLASVDSSYDMAYDEQSQRDRDKRNAVLDTPISDFELSVRSRNCLRQMNIRSLGDLLRTSEAELLSYKNFGETSLNEIKAVLAQRSLRLGQALQPPPEPLVSEAPPPVTLGDASIHARRSISELELSVRSRKALQRLGVTTLGELAIRSEPELLAIKNFGQTSLSEIKRQLALYGLSLRAHP